MPAQASRGAQALRVPRVLKQAHEDLGQRHHQIKARDVALLGGAIRPHRAEREGQRAKPRVLNRALRRDRQQRHPVGVRVYLACDLLDKLRKGRTLGITPAYIRQSRLSPIPASQALQDH